MFCDAINFFVDAADASVLLCSSATVLDKLHFEQPTGNYLYAE